MHSYQQLSGPIGVFDSGYGGLTILHEFRKALPTFDYLYLGDNARAPYGPHSFDVIYRYTLQAVKYLFSKGCHLVILACNTASAKALRTIQQVDLPVLDATRRVLGIIHPTAEAIGHLTHSQHIGILGTIGTIQSGSYEMEIQKRFPAIQVTGKACPMWVPLVENYEYDSLGADYFVQKYLNALMHKDPEIDTIILGCTHYPLLQKKIEQFKPSNVGLMPQGMYVAQSLKEYLTRHPEMAERCTQNGKVSFLTTESATKFAECAHIFLQEEVTCVTHIELTDNLTL